MLCRSAITLPIVKQSTEATASTSNGKLANPPMTAVVDIDLDYTYPLYNLPTLTQFPVRGDRGV